MVGFDEGSTVFVALGNSVGIIEGTSLLFLEEINEGSSDGDSLVDVADGMLLGRIVSATEGTALGCIVLTIDGSELGFIVLATEGPALGPNDGSIDGKEDGISDDLLVG